MSFKKLPKCSSYKSWTDCGYEYDCEAHENIESCTECLCKYKNTCGLINPETGKKINKFLAFILYGRRDKC